MNSRCIVLIKLNSVCFEDERALMSPGKVPSFLLLVVGPCMPSDWLKVKSVLHVEPAREAAVCLAHSRLCLLLCLARLGPSTVKADNLDGVSEI